MLINAPDELKRGIEHKVSGLVAAAAPPAAMIEGMEQDGLQHHPRLRPDRDLRSGDASAPSTRNGSELPLADQVRLNGRQGVRYTVEEGLTVMDPETMKPVPADGETMGEIMFRGNITMKGYLKNPKATQEAFAGGWFHSGDLAVMQPDGYVKIKDRSKDVIISGGENISSLEVEDVLYRHPAVMAAAVVAPPGPEVGRDAVRLRRAQAGRPTPPRQEIIEFCRGQMAKFKAPRAVVFGELPKTSTGKIQKFVLREKAKSTAAIDT